MKIAISGATGFLGSWIARVLSSKHEIVAITRGLSDNYRILGIENLVIASTETMTYEEIFSEFKPDVLIVCSWWGVGNADRNNVRQRDNLAHTLEIGLAANKIGIEKVIGVGSQAELGPVSDLIHDDQPDNPTTLYGVNKVKMRNQYLELFDRTGIDFKWLRIFSTYGPLDTGDWMIPKLIDTISANSKMELTWGEQEWSYLHAYDLALAFQSVIEIDSKDYIFNVGNPNTIKIKEAASLIADELKRPDLVEFGAIPYRHDQVMRLHPLCTSLLNLGWKPTINFQDGIRQTINWLQRKESSQLITAEGALLDFNLPTRL